MLQTIEKVGLVLDLFTAARPRWSLSAVAEEIRMPRSSAHGLLSALVDVGLLRTAERGIYVVGWRPFEMGSVHRHSLDLHGAGQRTVDALARDTGESAQLTVLDRGRVQVAACRRGTHRVCVKSPPRGSVSEPYAGAAGKVLLAHRHHPEAEELPSARLLRRLTPATPATPEDVMRELDRVREQGVAIDRGEVAGEIWCVAAPVRDELGLIVAAIGVSLPRFRSHALPEIERTVVAAASGMSPLSYRDDRPLPDATG